MNHINKMPLAVCLKWDVLNEPVSVRDLQHRGSQLPQMSSVGPSTGSWNRALPASSAKCETDGYGVPTGWLWGAALRWKRSDSQDELNAETHLSSQCHAPKIAGIVLGISFHSHVFRIQKTKVQETGFGENTHTHTHAFMHIHTYKAHIYYICKTCAT